MKQIITGLLILVSCYSIAQEDFATIYYWQGEGYMKNVSFELAFNNQKITSFSTYELVEYKMYSSGMVTIECYYYNNPVESYQLDIKPGETYYFYAHIILKGKEKGNKRLDLLTEQSEIDEFFKDESYFLRKRQLEEDITNPIADLPEELIQTRPKQGTGFLISEEGYILTNFHVIDNANKVLVMGINGDYSTTFQAIVIAVDRLTDQALLKVESKIVSFQEPPYRFANSKSTIKAEPVFALGYPIMELMGEEIKITEGIINSNKGIKNSISEMQFSAPVQPGNSGSPLINMNGEVIGLISAKIDPLIAESAAYALKSNYIKTFLSEAIDFKSTNTENSLNGKELTELVRIFSDFIYIIKTE